MYLAFEVKETSAKLEQVAYGAALLKGGPEGALPGVAHGVGLVEEDEDALGLSKFLDDFGKFGGPAHT